MAEVFDVVAGVVGDPRPRPVDHGDRDVLANFLDAPDHRESCPAVRDAQRFERSFAAAKHATNEHRQISSTL